MMKHQTACALRYPFLLSLTLLGLMSCDRADDSQVLPPSTQIQELFWVKDQGTEMPVLISGNQESDKIILAIHGGPGGSSIATLHFDFKELLEKDVLVAYWDQRLAGLSINTIKPTAIPFEQYAQDCKQVIEKLKQKFPDKKIVLWGQSWGGLIVSQFITEANYQNLYDGWIIVNGITTNGFEEFTFRREGLIQRAMQRVS